MTDSFIKAVEAEPGTTYGRLLSAMRTRIRDGQGSRRLPGRLGSFVRWMIPSSGVQVIFFISTRRDCWTATPLTHSWLHVYAQEPQLCSSEMFDSYRKPFLL